MTSPVPVDSLLEVDDLVVVRGARPVLAIEHLAIVRGETLVVVGPNGAGKSTLLLALARLLRPQRGRVAFRESPGERDDDLAHRRRIGLVLPDPILLDASVFDNVASGLRFRGVPRDEVRARVADWLGRLGIAHLRDRPARQISSGEAQRASLARALVVEPDLLLLDEPFASVDAMTRALLLDDLENLLRATPVTCVAVTHDLDEAVRLGDRVAVLLEGRLRQCDHPERVLAAPVDGDVAAFVGVETRVLGRVVEARDGLAVVEAAGHHLEAVSSVGPGRAVLFCLRPEDVTLWSDDHPGDLRDVIGSGDHPGPGDRPGSGSALSSARNRLPGRVSRITPSGPLVRVSVDCGVPLVALITRASADEMGLAVGRPVVATFKATAAHLIPLARDQER
jgi:tungstate transport system ATP-binding protein